MPGCLSLLFLALLVPAAGGSVVSDDGWHVVRVKGGLAALARESYGSPRIEAWRALYELARLRYPIGGEVAVRRPPEDEPQVAPPGPLVAADEVPLPLSPGTWRRLLGRKVDDDELAAAILADRRTAVLLRGLSALDDDTLNALAGAPGALERLLRESAGEVLALFGGRLRVLGGAIAVPGGALAEPWWTKAVGASPREPAAFATSLVRRDGGRLAWLFDTLAGLDPERLRLVVGDDDARTVAGRLDVLGGAFRAQPAWWLRSYGRPAGDPARLLRELRLATDHSLAPPVTLALWQELFEGRASAKPAPGKVEIAWLLDKVASGSAGESGLRLQQVLLAQRVFGAAGETARVDLVGALRGLESAPALVLTLERMGLRDPSAYAALVRQATAAIGASGHARPSTLAQLQGALALLERARFARAIDPATTLRLSQSLGELRVDPAGGCEGRVATWLEQVALPALSRAVYGDAPPGDADAIVRRAMAGAVVGAEKELARFDWEDLAYRADVGAAELQRLERVGTRLAEHALDPALRLCRAARGREELRACDDAVGRALVRLVYAAALGDPATTSLAAGDVPRRHDFGERAYDLPVEVNGPDTPWHVQGALLSLDLALAPQRLRTIDPDEMPEAAPIFDREHRAAFAASIALLDPRDLSDAARDGIAAALARGRERAARLAPAPDGIGAAARDAGLPGWRRSALRFVAKYGADAAVRFFTPLELLRLGGRPVGEWEAWGAADPFVCGLVPCLPRGGAEERSGWPPQQALAAQFPDVVLSVAEALAARRLPAALAPALAAVLTAEMLGAARPFAFDDTVTLGRWLGELPAHRIDDAIATLAGDGPLRPISTGGRP